MIKKLFLVGAIVVATAGTAFAQLPVGLSPFNTPAKRPPTAEEVAKQKALDDAYKSATSKIPDQQKADDPWADVRPTPNPPPKKSTTAKQSSASKQTTAAKSNQQ
jgi:hypothetical protein